MSINPSHVPPHQIPLIHVAQRVLILDDDLKTVDTVALLVAALGYTAVRCSEPTHAIHRLESEHFDLFLSDYDMPQINGLEVIELLRKKHIEVPALLMSGHATIVDPTKTGPLKITHVLKKPFTVAELEQALRHTLFLAPQDSTRVILSQIDGYRSQSPYPPPPRPVPLVPE